MVVPASSRWSCSPSWFGPWRSDVIRLRSLDLLPAYVRQIRCTQVSNMRAAYRVAVSVVGLAGTEASLGPERRYRHEAIPTVDRRRRAHPGDATDGTRRDRLMERRGGGPAPLFFLSRGGGIGGFPPPRRGNTPPRR